jgi:hypothetical protein
MVSSPEDLNEVSLNVIQRAGLLRPRYPVKVMLIQCVSQNHFQRPGHCDLV